MKFTMKQLITHSIMFLLMPVSVIAQAACQKQPVSMLGADADANGTAPQAKPLPRVLLIGDSICGGYCKGVRAKLAGKAVVVKPADNGRDTWRGLEFFGAPGTDEFIDNTGKKAKMDLTLHGKIGNTPASQVEVIIECQPPYDIRIRGRVDEKTLASSGWG